jgi:putative aminopeptidase FrvX
MTDAYLELIGRLLEIMGDVGNEHAVEALIEPVLKQICKKVGLMTDDDDDNIILSIRCDDRVYEAKLHVDISTSVRFKEIWRAPDTYAYLFDEDEEE